MKRDRGIYVILLTGLLFASCSVKERPISYGEDECDYCKMTIMDHRYGSELVSDKGKIYTFDAAECLIDFLHQHEEIGVSAKYLLVTPYTQPDFLFDATRATYLVSKNLPSPMGAYLTAFSTYDTAAIYMQENTGELYDWETLRRDFRTIKRNVIETIE